MSEITKEQVEKFRKAIFILSTGIPMPPDDEECQWLRDTASALISAWERKQETCKWTCSPVTFIGTECGRRWPGASPGPSSGIYFCFHCGRRIEEVKDGN